MNRKVIRYFAAAALTAGLLLQGALTAFAGGIQDSIKVSTLKAAKDNKHLVLIVADTEDKTKVKVLDYTKDEQGVWRNNWIVEGICGKNGISADKKEGDKKTPEGQFSALMNFGIEKDPGSKLPYHKISKNDFWVDDSESVYYNQMVNINKVKKDWSSAENMIKQAPYYNYAIALDYNKEGVPYKGSAIFIHCTKTAQDTYSAGCVRIAQEDMIQLVQEVDADTKFIIVPNIEGLAAY